MEREEEGGCEGAPTSTSLQEMAASDCPGQPKERREGWGGGDWVVEETTQPCAGRQ